DDGHVFITEDQITSESVAITRLILDIYRDFGFEDVGIRYADRPPKRVGSDDIWDRAEAALKAASAAAGIEYTLNRGEGAFYGPKLEFVLRDAIGRDWQCGTLQVDLNMPERLGAYYIDEHSAKRIPVMLHRAMFGSLERFLAILLEHHAGKLPAWLSPVQAVVIGITERQDEYVLRVTETLKNQGLRVESDLRNEEVNAPQLRVIAADGSQAGVMSRFEALQMASAAELDLVEVSPTAEPPVVRIMDYGKFLFEQNKKAHSAKRKQKQIQVKEVKFRPGTGEADYKIKLRNLTRFLTEGDKAKVTLRFRGREMVHQDLGRKLLDRVCADLAPHAVIEQNPLMEGK